MIHRSRWRVASRDALGFWADRLAGEGVLRDDDRDGGGDDEGLSLRFRDPEGLELELAVVESGDEPLRAVAQDIAAEHALLGFDGVRAYGVDREQEHRLLTDVMGFTMTGPGDYALQRGRRRAAYAYDVPPPEAGRQGAGSVHHIAWCDRDDEHAA